MPARRIVVLAYDGCSAWVAAAIVEAFELARTLSVAEAGSGPAGTTAARRAAPEAGFASASGRPVAASSGVVLPAAACPGFDAATTLVVPPVWHESVAGLERRLDALGPEIGIVQDAAGAGATVASVCSGALLLARAGLLDGREATGCWWLERHLASRHRAVRWRLSRTLVRDGPVITAGSATAYASLALALVAGAAGAHLARRTAQFLAIEPNRDSQAAFAGRWPGSPSTDPLVAGFERWVAAHFARDASLAAATRALRTSERTLFRRVRAATGRTPHALVQALRLEHAKDLLVDTTLPVEAIGARCGWQDASSFRRLFARQVGMAPAAWRRAFAFHPGER